MCELTPNSMWSPSAADRSVDLEIKARLHKCYAVDPVALSSTTNPTQPNPIQPVVDDDRGSGETDADSFQGHQPHIHCMHTIQYNTIQLTAQFIVTIIIIRQTLF